MWALIPPPFRIYAMLAMAALMIGAGVWVYSVIYSRGYDAAMVAAEHKMDELRAANDAAIARAEEALRDDIAALETEKKALEDEVAKLDAEALADPDARTGGISAGSVRRLNAVR